MRQSRTDPLGPETYCCHAYLTFVARPRPVPPPSFGLLAWTDSVSLTVAPTPKRVQLPEVKPSTLLGKKRYLLAGRRRAHRLQRAKEQDALNASFRQALSQLERSQRDAALAEAKANEPNQERLIASLQLEIVTEAYLRKSPDVRVEGEHIVGEIEGFVEPVRIQKAEVEAALKKRGHGSWHRIVTANDDEVERAGGHGGATVSADRTDGEVASHLDFADTLSMVRNAPRASWRSQERRLTASRRAVPLDRSAAARQFEKSALRRNVNAMGRGGFDDRSSKGSSHCVLDERRYR